MLNLKASYLLLVLYMLLSSLGFSDEVLYCLCYNVAGEMCGYLLFFIISQHKGVLCDLQDGMITAPKYDVLVAGM
jgi:hypothetical protein